MTAFFTRHCKTNWNLENRLQGSVDQPLCAVGVQESNENALCIVPLGIQLVVTSPLLRASQTAEIYTQLLGAPIVVCEALREIDHGIWEGQLIPDLLADPASGYSKWLYDPGIVTIPGGSESSEAAQQRVVEGVCAVLDDHPNSTVLFVSHKHILGLLRCTTQGHTLENFKTLIPEAVEPFQIDRKALSFRLTT